MAHRASSFTLAAFVLSAAPLLYAQLTQIPGIGATKSSSSLPDPEIASGLKEALSVGTQKAVKLVAQPDGYLDNEAIRILLPRTSAPPKKPSLPQEWVPRSTTSSPA